mgnify:CR=1 FL=1
MKSFSQMHEEGSDGLKDRRMERGGVGGNQRYNKPVSNTPNTFGKKKPKYDGMSALEKVKADIRAKHGEGAIKEDAKMGKQSDEKLAALHKQVSGADQSLPSNQFMLKRVTKEMNRRKKATKTEGYAPGDVDQKVGAVTPIPKKDQDDARARILAKAAAKRKARLTKEEVITERGDYWHPDPEKDKKLGGPGANARAREDRADAAKPKEDPKKLKKGESYMDYSKRQKASKQKSGTATSRLNAMGANIKPKKKSLLGRLGLKKEEVNLQEKSPIELALDSDKKLMKLHTKDNPAPKGYAKKDAKDAKESMMSFGNFVGG